LAQALWFNPLACDFGRFCDLLREDMLKLLVFRSRGVPRTLRVSSCRSFWAPHGLIGHAGPIGLTREMSSICGLPSASFSWVQRYRNLLRQRPYVVGFVFCFGKGVAADVIAQCAFEDRNEMDHRRTLAAAFFSGSFCGCAYHAIFNIWFARLFGTSSSARVVVSKTLADGCVAFPFMYMPWYVACDEFIRCGSCAGILRRWQAEINQVMIDYLKVWPLACLVAFSVVPTELRTTFMALVSFCWLILLSMITHEGDSYANKRGAFCPGWVAR